MRKDASLGAYLHQEGYGPEERHCSVDQWPVSIGRLWQVAPPQLDIWFDQVEISTTFTIFQEHSVHLFLKWTRTH